MLVILDLDNIIITANFITYNIIIVKFIVDFVKIVIIIIGSTRIIIVSIDHLEQDFLRNHLR